MEAKKLKWKVEKSTGEESVARGRLVDSSSLVVELAPMEIRTFILKFDLGHVQSNDR